LNICCGNSGTQVSIKEQLSMITSTDDFELRQSPEKGTLSGTATIMITGFQSPEILPL
jgi:hypothetical protein